MVYQTRFEINLDQLKTNIKQITTYKNKTFAFVVKANAYGHGIIQIVKELNQIKEVSYICVANIIEALHIRPYTTKDIWILGDTPLSMLDVVYKHDFILSLSNDDILKHITQNVRVFCNIDTGFHRLGQSPSNSYKKQIISLENNSFIEILGLFTHLQLLDKETVTKQIQALRDFRDSLPTRYPLSISDSIAFTRYNITEDTIRIGSLMYGLTSKSEIDKIDIKPIQSLKTTITHVKTLDHEDSLYYHKLSYPKGTVIATIPIGYADGLFRDVSHDQVVSVNSKKCKILSVSMDQAAIDITGLHVEVGEEVIIFGQNGISLQEYSEQFHTNKNEILTKISSRVPRLYFKQNNLYDSTISIKRWDTGD